MALVLKDRVVETTNVAGTGTATLLGAQDGYQAFSVVGNGNTTYYTIADPVNFDWEVGIGTYTSSGNTLSRDTVLSSSNSGSLVSFGAGTKDIFLDLPSEKVAALGALSYQGTWNATTNVPTLASGVGTQGYYYVVATAGSTNLDGITDWKIGDWAIYSGTAWQKIDNTDAVSSVNGQTGTVVLTTTDIAEGTNEYFTTAKARASVSAGTGISYDSGTGVITNSAPDQTVALTDGTAIDVTGTYPNFTINNTAPDQVVALTAGTGISTSGTYPNFTITNTSPSLGGDVVGPASSTDNAIARFDLTTGKLLQNSVVTVSDAGAIAGATTITDLDYLDFDTTYATTLGAGQLGWNGNDTLGLGMIGGNVVQHIGEDTFFYVKASATITKGQLCMFTGTVGSSGVLTAAPSTAIPYAEAIIGVAAEDIANNAFGLIQNLGTLKGVNTSAFLDGDILYYNSAVTGGFTKTFPTSGPIVVAAAVGKAGSGGSGVLIVRVSFQTRVTAGTGISVTQGNDSVAVTNTGVTSVGGTGTVNGLTLTGTVTTTGNLTLGGTLSGIANSALTNSSITINGVTIALGGSSSSVTAVWGA